VPDPNYYEMLEIPTNATPEQVREAYRLLTMVWHPDRFPKDSKLWTHANERMQQINEAYNALKNVQETDARPTAPPTASSQNNPAEEQASGRANSANPQWNGGQSQRQQADDPWQRIEEQKRRLTEQKRREEEQKRREEEQKRREMDARHSIESEQRRTEAERLRLLMREKQRVEQIQQQRAEQGLCVMCGQPLSRIEKFKRRDRHRDCTEFMDDTSANKPREQAEPTVSDA
jgi:curved DNA-binding protein CbpA